MSMVTQDEPMSTSAAPTKTSPNDEKRPSDAELTQIYQAFRQDLASIAAKLGELEMEKDEHDMVIKTISELEPERKCFRMVGGVLVERTIQDVVPAVQTNLEGIKQVIAQIVSTYKKKEEEFVAFTKKYNIQVRAG